MTAGEQKRKNRSTVSENVAILYAERYNLSTAPQNKLASNLIQRLHRANACDPDPSSVTYMPSSRTKSVGRVGSFVRKWLPRRGKKRHSPSPLRKQRNDQAFIKRTDLCGDSRKGKSKKGGNEGAHLARSKFDGNGWCPSHHHGKARMRSVDVRASCRAVQEFLCA